MILKCKGFLFDLDGTLINSLPNIEFCWREFSHRIGVPEKDVLQYIHGRPAIDSIRHFIPNASEAEIDKVFSWLKNLEESNISEILPLPGAIDILNQLNLFNIPWAIVTSSRFHIALNRSKSAKLPEPKHWITIDQVKKGKPHPDPFLLGSAALNLSPRDCVVFEDTQAGINSALDAGCQVIALFNVSVNITDRVEEVSLVIREFSELDISKPDSEGIFLVSKK